MLKFGQMTGRGLANAAGQAVAMHCLRGRKCSGVTKPAPPGPLCCILRAFSGVAPLRTDGKLTVKLLSGGGRHRSRVTFALTGGGLHSCAACQLSEHHSDHVAAARTIGHYKSCRICQSCCIKPSLIVQPHAAMR